MPEIKEKLSVDNLPVGTSAALEIKASAKKCLKKNGKPNVSLYLRKLIEKETGIKE